MQLHWKFDEWPSVIYAGAALARGDRFVDAQLAASLAEPFERVSSALATRDIGATEFWENALRSPGQAPAAEETVARAIERFHAAMLRLIPNLRDELELRSGPLRELWQGHGPGLIGEMARRMQAPPLRELQATPPREASIHCVYPILGGGGLALPECRAVVIETLLANPNPRLPETVRLGWLLAQLMLPLTISSQQAAAICVPIALAAAEEMEWARYDERTLHEAQLHWRLS